MASIINYRKKWLKYHASYEKRASKVLYRTFKKWVKQIDFNNINVLNYTEVISRATTEEDLLNDCRTIYTTIGLLHGKRIGRNINKEAKFFNLLDFETAFINFVENYLINQQSYHIRQIANTFRVDINTIVAKMIKDGAGSEEIARELQKKVNRRNFYRWQARRIARTETTAAANLAALQAGNIAGFKTNKIWISASDVRTRRITGPGTFRSPQFDHLAMNGAQVDIDDVFKVPSTKTGGYEAMRYPGDRGGVSGVNTTSAGNVINCRCTVSVVPARDSNGQLIPLN